MSQTKKASLVELKKFFGYDGDGATQKFAADVKALTPEDKAELADLLGTQIESGAVVLLCS